MRLCDRSRNMAFAINSTFAGIDASWNPKINLSLGALTAQNLCRVTLVNIDNVSSQGRS